ncbi:MAG: hypothetical protein KatS3mg008_2089 [Acidimicrobiales bacterium]|nr:MAG: hypothetical protein KatS3mg008_2089 [Acidimicrobiales bacterium]
MQQRNCPRCGRPAVEISVTLDGEPMAMLSCSSCDHRWWFTDDGELVDIDGILSKHGVERRKSD